ncbi:hypothetical protein X770_23665 [Mesorhizobium sp. LSJC269B00]|nr:hypothetical protein X770_23665 [Mesorhizobium sp. LSJC269B00]
MIGFVAEPTDGGGAAVAIRPALQRNGYPGATGRCGRDCGAAETERIGMEP